jgi:CRP-like cAMP-binding protein
MRAGSAPAASAPLLEEDPDLGRHVPPARLVAVTAALVVRTLSLPAGAWNPADGVGVGDVPPGALLLSGVMSKDVSIPGGRAAEILGPGDFVDSAEILHEHEFLDATVSWSVIEAATIAVMDADFMLRLRECPEVYRALLERGAERTARLGLIRAATHVGRVEDRLLALMWQLAERHGRVGSEGVILPIKLRHRVLGDLVGAGRSTVTLALGALERRGAIARRIDGGWALLAPPDESPAPSARRAAARSGSGSGQSDRVPSADLDVGAGALHARVVELRTGH